MYQTESLHLVPLYYKICNLSYHDFMLLKMFRKSCLDATALQNVYMFRCRAVGVVSKYLRACICISRAASWTLPCINNLAIDHTTLTSKIWQTKLKAHKCT